MDVLQRMQWMPGPQSPRQIWKVIPYPWCDSYVSPAPMQSIVALWEALDTGGIYESFGSSSWKNYYKQ